MNELIKEELVLLDEVLGYVQMIGYVDFSKYDYIIDDINEYEAEERTGKDIQIIRDKIKIMLEN